MSEASEKKNIREEFLRLFVRNIVKLSYKPEPPHPLEHLKEYMEIPKHKIPIVSAPRAQVMHRGVTEISGERMQPSTPITPMQNVQPMQPRAPQGGQISLGSGMSFGKISQILRDPSVFSVECPGPGKNILVNKAGKIQVSSTRLAKEEIDVVMEEISEKTRIPVTPGIFKTAYQNLIITAVVSEFVGTRFVIHKRNPYRRY